MNNYVLWTDCSADLTDEMVRELDVQVLPLCFTMEDKTYKNWPDNREIDPGDFYRSLREGAMATTSAVNVGDYTDALTPHLEAGKDVMLLVVQGEYEAVQETFRADVGETLTAQNIQDLALRQLDGAGVYKQIEKAMTTGQSSDGEHYGVAVLYCEFAEKDILFRLAFDGNMSLIGMDIRQL